MDGRSFVSARLGSPGGCSPGGRAGVQSADGTAARYGSSHSRKGWAGLGGLPHKPVRWPCGDLPQGQPDGKSLQATALCEAYEESGLQVRLITHLVDVRRTQTFTRYYLAERMGGSPADMGWESQGVMLVPREMLGSLDLAPADRQVVLALAAQVQP